MSLYGDFRRVWMERFPESDLPAAWEEDVRSNLHKHRQRVQNLKDELDKEEKYVLYLEQLLVDVEKHKTRAAGDGEAAAEDSSCRTDSSESGIENSDRKFSKSCSQNSIDLCISEIADNQEKSGTSPTAAERSISVDETAKKEKLEARPRSLTQPNLSQFITVIEINQEKKKLPPKPPPKTFKPEGELKMGPAELLKEAATIRGGKEETEGEKEGRETAAKLIERFSGYENSESPYGKIKRVPEASKLSPVRFEIFSREIRKEEDERSFFRHAPPPPVNREENRPKSVDSLKKLKGEDRKTGIIEELDDGVEYFTLCAPEELSAEHEIAADVKKSPESEPYYDSVPIAADDSDSECVVEALTLPSRTPLRALSSSQTAANYVNIDYFIKQRSDMGRSNSIDSENEIDGDVADLDCDLDNEVDPSNTATLASDATYESTSSLDSAATKLSGSDDELMGKIVESIVASEMAYLECLNVLLQYMKALKATLTTSQPVISEDELNTVFYKIPELHKIHVTFLEGLKGPPPYGQYFKKLAENLNDYGAFLHNYGRATDTVKRKCQSSQQFSEITSEIKLKSGQVISLEDLLHKPVARVQKNALVLDDLMKCSTLSSDQEAFKDALTLTKAFLDSFNMIETKKMFGHEDRAQRRLVKNSFMVELVEGHRKLRHLFLFNDVMACAKYKAAGRDKFTFELKWYIHLNDLIIHEESGNEPKEVNPPNLLQLKSQACTVRDQILREEEKRRSGLDKQRKKLADLEAQLVLAYPDLVLKVGSKNSRSYCFLLSSEFERTQWIEAVEALKTISQQSHLPNPKQPPVTMPELQAWVTACRAFLKTNMGSYLLRSGHDESLLRGDLRCTLGQLQGLTQPADVYLVLEVDSYGHYFRKARSKLVCRSVSPKWDQRFVLDLEGSQNLRVLLYEEVGGTNMLRGKFTLKLSMSWLDTNEVMKVVNLNSGVTLSLHLSFHPAEMSVRRVPQSKPAGFGSKIQQVCKREDRTVPFLITSCVREIERRGFSEVGIYRVSGSLSDLSRLKKAFETNAYEAEQLLKEVCVHSVTGILKQYLRELPEALFTDALYDNFVNAWSQGEERRGKSLAACYQQLPRQNKAIIDFLLDHLIRVNQQEAVNKMSLHNLATVFGPTLIRPNEKSAKSRDLLAKSTVDVMAQAGILHYFLLQKQVR